MQQEDSPIELAHYAVRTRGGCSYKTTTTGRASSSSPIAARGLDVPGKRLPRGVAHPRYANPSRCNPGKDEHQLVRSAAGELAHRASRRATLFAPGAGAPTRLRCPEGRLRCPEGASLSLPYTRKMM